MVSAPPRALTSMCSTPLRSMVTLPMSRVSLARLPLAEMSMVSPMLAPLNRSVSVPAWPSTVSLASPGFQMNVSSPAPSNATSLPVPPMTTSLPRLPVMVSLPAPPLIVRLIWPALSAEALMVSFPASPSMTSESLPPSVPAIVTCAAKPLTTTEAPLLATLMWSSPAVPLAVALAGSRRRREVEGDPRDVGSGQVVDRDGVGTAQGIDLDMLDAVEVHDDGADVARKPRPLAVGRDVHVLADVGAIEHERIRAGLPLDDVAAVARVPDERVVAGAEQGRVVAAAAEIGRASCRERVWIAVVAGSGS